MIKKIYILIFLFLGLISKQTVIKLNNVALSDSLKQSLEKIWQKITDKKSLIDINSEKRIIFLKGKNYQIKEFEKIVHKLDKPTKKIQLNIETGLTNKDALSAFGIDYFGIYNRNNSIKKSRNFGFMGIGGSLYEYPLPTASLFDPLLVAPIPNISYIFNLQQNNIFFTSNSPLSATFSGPNINTQRLTNSLFLFAQDKNVSILSKQSIIVNNRETAKFFDGEGYPLYTQVPTPMNDTIKLIFTTEYKPIGFFIHIKPIIAKGNVIILEILIENTVNAINSGPIYFSTGVNAFPPVLDLSRVFMTVYLRANQSFMLFDFNSNQLEFDNYYTPFIHRLPIIGKLFTVNTQPIKLGTGYIMITPKIIED